MLRHLKRHGLSEAELVRVYTTILRATTEFCAVVYGPMLTKEMSEALEHTQSQALKIIFGFNNSYREVLEKSGLQRLDERRRSSILRFAEKAQAGRYSHWFPKNTARKTRKTTVYKEEYARTERMKNSPIFFMRRMLNEQYL